MGGAEMINPYRDLRYFRLPPRRRWDLCSSGTLSSAKW